MPKYDLTSGLPDLPPGLPDKEFNLVAPLYRAVSAIAQRAAASGNFVQYSADELAVVNALTALALDRTNRIIVKAAATLAYGKLVTIGHDGTNYTATIADNTAGSGSRAHGCVSSTGGIASGAFGEVVFMQGLCPGVSGTTIGTTYYLGAAGVATATQTLGTIQQVVGIGLGTAGLFLTTEHSAVTVAAVTVADAGTKGLRIHKTDGTSYDI